MTASRPRENPRLRVQLNQAYQVLQAELEQLKTLNGQLTVSLTKLAKREIRRQVIAILQKAETPILKGTTDFLGNVIEERNRRKDTKSPISFRRLKKSPISSSISKLFLEMTPIMNFDQWAVNFIRTMSLVYLISVFENFLHRILVALFAANPGSISEKQVKVASLLDSGSVRKAVMAVREKEANDILSRDIEEIREYFKGKFGLDFASFADWKRTKESFYRRHVIVHSQGKIDQNYRIKTGYRGKMAWQLAVTEEYLTDSISRFQSICVGSLNSILKPPKTK